VAHQIIPNLLPEKETTFRETLPHVPDGAVQVVIRDPNTTTLTQGPATLAGPQAYAFDWTVPSYPTFGAHQIEWTYTYGGGDHTDTISRFFVVVAHPITEEYKQVGFVMENESDVWEMFSDFPVVDLSVQVEYIGSLEGIKFPTPTSIGTYAISNKVIEVQEPDQYRYTLSLPGLTRGEYLIYWKYRPLTGKPFERVVDIVWSAPHVMFSLIKQLRVYVDKIQKQAGIIQAYSDGELCNNYVKALNYVNRVHPFSTWTFSNFPWQWFEHFLVEAAAWWTLRTQYLLEGDMQFSYGGQTITLEYDHLSFLSEELGRLERDIGADGGGGGAAGTLPAAKKQYRYDTGIQAVVAVRTRKAHIPRWG